MVMKKLRLGAPPLTADMDPAVLEEIIRTLFPPQEDSPGQRRSSSTRTVQWRKELGVAKEEMLDATKKMASRNVAPGPDGVPGRIWAETMAIMAPRLRHLFTRCLREGVYLRIWCMARLVLLVLPGGRGRL